MKIRSEIVEYFRNFAANNIIYFLFFFRNWQSLTKIITDYPIVNDRQSIEIRTLHNFDSIMCN